MSTIALYRKRISRSLEGCTFGPSLRICLFEEGFSLDLFGFLISLPFLDRFRYEPHEIMEAWGVYLDSAGSRQWLFTSVVWCWGDYVKFFHMPWEFTHIRNDVLRPDGTWAKRVACYDKGEPDGRKVEKFPYRYTLRNGESQEVMATVHVERMEWRRTWTKWCPWFAKVRTYLEIEFNGEVGERAGSWKGGCIGCSYEMKQGETPEQCLRRMERERTFR